MSNHEINRHNPTAFLFLVDQSYSMTEDLEGGFATKAQFVADVLNRTFMELVTRSTKVDGVRDYFHVGVLGYGHEGVRNTLTGKLSGAVFNPVSVVSENPVRVEDRMRKVPDGAGGIIEISQKFPVWFEAYGNGATPMCSAFSKAAEVIAEWCDAHPESEPPTIIHVTDGMSTDGDPEEIAQATGELSTEKGKVLVLNLHVSESSAEAIRYPASADNLPNEYSKVLFRMSSFVPDHMREYARTQGVDIPSGARGFLFQADAAGIAEFFDFGTKAAEIPLVETEVLGIEQRD